MSIRANKTKEKKSQLIANAFSQKKSSNESTSQFLDNRSQTMAQIKLQGIANNSLQAIQLKAIQAMTNSGSGTKQATQLQIIADTYTQQQQPIQKKDNNTGLPDNLKTGIENLSGMSLDDVKVHRNSHKPAQLQAHAYAQGNHIHLGPGQEKHLPHEAWHVVQQKQGRVKPTMQMKGKISVNDEVHLEKEADVMGGKALKSGMPITPYAKQNTLRTRFFSSSFQRKRYVAKATFGSVIQRVYLNDGHQITYVPPMSAIPPGYVYTGMHNDGVHGPDQLYQHPSLLSAAQNPHLQQLGYGKHPVEDIEIDPPEEVAESSPGKATAHHVKSIRKKLSSSKKRYLEEDSDSSDSEEATGHDPERQRNRRFFKAGQLEAIGKTMFPLSEDEMEFHEKLGTKRQRDDSARGDKRDMYASDTRKMFTQIGHEFRKTSLAHNPYYRRSFRKAVRKKHVKTGGSKKYNSQQGKIRTKLLEVIRKDHAKMKWRQEDFSSKKMWQAVQHLMKEKLSNPSKGDTFAERLEANQDTGGSSARVAFHHSAWKEAMGGQFEEDALNPHGLTALNDTRELLNPKKRRKLKKEGKPMPKFGAHDAFGHQGSGFLATQKGKMKRSKGGGQFVDMDAEAVDQILKVLVRPRVKKKKLYAKSTKPKTSKAAESAKKKPADLEQREKMEHFAQDIQYTAQQLQRALANQGNAGDLQRTQLRVYLQQVYAAIPGVNLDDPANVQYLRNMNNYLNILMVNARYLLRRVSVSQRNNPLGPYGDRLPALEQFFAECGQMAAHNALALEAHPNLLHPNTAAAIGNEAALTAHGNFDNNITEGQIRDMVAAAGRPTIPVVGNIGQVQNIINLLNAGNLAGLAPFMLNANDMAGIQSIRRFLAGLTQSLVMVVNTVSHKGLKAVGYHWITVRFTRRPDGQLAIHFLDSLLAPADYSGLFHTLRTFLGHVPAQAALLPAPGQLPPGQSSSGGSTTSKNPT